MKDINILTVIVIILNLLIVIPFGHGIVILGLLETPILLIPSHDNPITFSLSSYDESIPLVSLLSLIGQILLLISFLKSKSQYVTKILGNSILLIAFILLCKDLFINELPRFSFFTGLPFLGASIGLFLMIARELKETPSKNS